ncbi:MAG: TolC family protein [Thermodesulfobacteriota bacterium]|nr:TolC family protein [Thermodesulfobacteriota bacterium]
MKQKVLLLSVLVLLSMVLYFPVAFCESNKEVVTLQKCYTYTLSTHEYILISQKQLEISQLLPKKALALVLPKLLAQGTYTKEKEAISLDIEVPPMPPMSMIVAPEDNWTGDVTFTQPLYEGKFPSAYRMGKKQIVIDEENRDLTIRNVLYQVAQAYFNVLKMQEIEKISRDTLQLSLEELRTAKARFKVGEVTKTDVLRAEVKVKEAERNLSTAENNLILTKNILSSLIGFEPDKDYELEKPDRFPAGSEDLKSLLKKAYSYRDDLRVKELQIDLARDSRKQTCAAFHPQVNLVWRYNWVEEESFSNPNEFWHLLVTIKIPIFSGGMRFWNLIENGERITQSKVSYERAKKDIEVEVKGAMLKVKTFESTLAALEKQVELGKEGYEIVSKQYKVGISTSLDVSDALTQYELLRINYINETYDYQLALLNLQRVIGVFADEYIKEYVASIEN